MRSDLSPLLSVIMPVYNGVATLPTALASILHQSGADLEIIVVDDGSTDQSAALARELDPRILCVDQPNRGPAAARNLGIEMARGDFVSFLDADDVWPAGRVAHHMGLLAQMPDVDLVIGPTQTVQRSSADAYRTGTDIPGGGIMPEQATPEQVTVPVLPAPLIQHQLGSLTCRRAVFARVGLLNPTLRVGEDKEWLQRVLAAGIAMHMTPVIALIYHLRVGSLTYGAINHNHWFIAALRGHLRQRRQAVAKTDLQEKRE